MSNIVCGPAQDRPLRGVSNLPNFNLWVYVAMRPKLCPKNVEAMYLWG